MTMKSLNMTTILNVKIICVVVLLMITVTAYNHWLSLQEENEKNIKYLISITDFLAKKKPVNYFSELSQRQDVTTLSVQDQILLLNTELQPILNDVCIPTNTIKFGFYSKQYESIVAIGPQPDISLLIGITPNQFTESYNTNIEQLYEKKNSIVWHGATIINHVKPIEEHGVVVGHVFASINQDAVSASIWKKTMNTFLGAFLMLLVCVTIFHELFIKLKEDLLVFAESIVAGHRYHSSNEITEITPILQSISEQTEKMTRLDRLNIIGEMAAGIAHEIRNPMTTVRGLLQFMSNKPQFINQKENFSLMIDELDRANSIITEFLSLAKNKAMEFSEYNLNTVIHDIYPLLQADALSHNCEVQLALQDIPDIFLDQNSIRQLLFNMVRNAVDAMQNHGIITISTETNDATVQLSIKDCGTGISWEIRDKLGTPFFTTKEQGTGLGLAICYRIVERHGATLTVESEPNIGTTFTITFNHI